jgi:hypothetical protein
MTDMEKFVSAGDKAISRLNDWSYYRDNYSLKIGDKESDEFNQFDTTLADLDSVIMTQYQIVAAAANVPATKLLGTTPKGFNSTGEYEEASYHEELKSIQANHMTALAERHHELVMKSYIAPKFGYIQTAVTWNPLDTPTALELAQTNLSKAQVGAALIASGAISSEDERARVAKDKESGYNELGEDDVPAGEEAMDGDFKESEHPRADNGQFGNGGSNSKKTENLPSAYEQAQKLGIKGIRKNTDEQKIKKMIEEHNAAESSVRLIQSGKKQDLPQYKNVDENAVRKYAKLVYGNRYQVDLNDNEFDARGLGGVDDLVSGGVIEPGNDKYKHQLTKAGREITHQLLVDIKTKKHAV